MKHLLLFVLFLPVQLIANAQQWLPLGPDDNNWPSADYATFPCLAITKTGIPYIAYYDIQNGHNLTVRKFKDGAWTNLPSAGTVTTAETSAYRTLAFDSHDVPYVAYTDIANNKATVKKFNGSAWEIIGTPGLSLGTPYNISIAIDHSGNPYIAYSDAGNGRKISVKKFDGNSWIDIGSSPISNGAANFVCFILDNNDVPYLAYSDLTNQGKAIVKKYDGSNWINVGNAGFSQNAIVSGSIAISANELPYVIYSDYIFSYSNRANIKRFDGTNWINAETPVLNLGEQSQGNTIIFDNDGNGYIAYVDVGTASKIAVKKFDGISWNYLGDQGISDKVNFATKVFLDDKGQLYAGLIESPATATLKKYDGRKWKTIGPSGFPFSGTQGASFAVDHQGVPFVAYAVGSKITVMKFDGVNWIGVGDPVSANSPAQIQMCIDNNNKALCCICCW